MAKIQKPGDFLDLYDFKLNILKDNTKAKATMSFDFKENKKISHILQFEDITKMTASRNLGFIMSEAFQKCYAHKLRQLMAGSRLRLLRNL